MNNDFDKLIDVVTELEILANKFDNINCNGVNCSECPMNNKYGDIELCVSLFDIASTFRIINKRMEEM